MQTSHEPEHSCIARLDALIMGGGVAGLWILDTLHRAGFAAALVETNALGTGQTIAAQGILHGGLKYTLRGMLTSAASAIAEMPLLWRECLAGERAPDLRNTRRSSDLCHLWQTASLSSRVAMLGARKGLRIAPTILAAEQRPPLLKSCPGIVARLDEQVIDTASLIANLAAHHAGRIIHHAAPTPPTITTTDGEACVQLTAATTENPLVSCTIRAHRLILAAGAGNESLRAQLNLPAQRMQRRPLHMVMLRGPHLPEHYGHCVDGMSTRITITTHLDHHGQNVWQLGGQLAERGVALQPLELIRLARSELRNVLPDLNLADTEFATYRVDRAEAADRTARRPDDVTLLHEGHTITVWPTKLALAPRAADKILESMPKPRTDHHNPLLTLPLAMPPIALPPWETATQWTPSDNIPSA